MSPRNEPADLLLLGGQILTMDPRNSVAEAVAVRDGKILAVGTRQEVESRFTAADRVVELDGRPVLPGLTDTHVHLSSDAGRTFGNVECRDLYDATQSNVAALCARLVEAAQSLPPGTWVSGMASPLQEFRLEERRLPRIEELDAALPEHPAYINFGPHMVVANSRALAARGITRDTPDMQGGTVVKNPTTGEPTGLLLERAQFLVKEKPADDVDQLAENILFELEKCARRGVTAIHDIVVNKHEVRAYQKLAREGRLPVRVHIVLRVIESQFLKESLLDLGFLQEFGSDWLRIGGIKMSIDGGFTGKNAAFSEPLDSHGHGGHGLIRIDQAELDDTVWRYHELGMRCYVHAIGDVALDMILESYEKALHRLPRQNHRHRVEHMGNWMMTPERTERARRLGILPIPNPPFLFFFGDPVVEMLGKRATEQGFPFRSLWDAGFSLTFGSDAPGYYPVDPLRDLGTAVAHETMSGQAVNASEHLTLTEALRTQTINAAYAGFVEDRLGSIEVGKLADLAVLGDDPRTFPTERFRDLPIDLTVIGGKVVHEQARALAAR